MGSGHESQARLLGKGRTENERQVNTLDALKEWAEWAKCAKRAECAGWVEWAECVERVVGDLECAG
jgi:hypothetical protein